MRIIETKVFTFEELSEEVQQKAIENLYDINVDFDWWDSMYEDASTVGLKLDSFGLERNLHATGDFIQDAETCAGLILESHGSECSAWKLANNFLYDLRQNDKKHFDDELDGLTLEGEDVKEELEEEFLKALLVEYAHMLQNEYEYLTSEKAIRETILCNNYEFTENGKLV